MTGKSDAEGFAGSNDAGHVRRDICLVTNDGHVGTKTTICSDGTE